MSFSHSENLSVVTASLKLDLSNATKLPAKERRLSRNLRALSFGLAMAALSSTAHAASGVWTNGDATNVWQDNLNWSVAPFPGNTTAVFTSTDTATFSTTGSGQITLGGTGIINVQSIFFGSATGNANAFTIGAATDTLDLTGSATNAAGGVIVGAAVTVPEQIGVAGTTINVSPTNTNFDNASTTAGATLTIAGNIGQPGTAATNLFFGADGANGAGGLVNVTGTINNTSSAALFIFKRDLNTATLAGAVTTGNGAINERGGVLNLTGTVNTGTAGINVTQGNGGSSLSATLNIAGTVNALNLVVQQGLTTVSGAVNQTGGTVTFSQGATATNFQIGAVATPGQNYSGYYKLSGGSVTANEIDVGGLFAASVGVMDVTGGTATSNGYLTIGRGTTTSSGTVNVTGGVFNTGANAALTGPIALNWATAAGAQSVLNVGGGTNVAAVTGGASTTQTGQFAGRGLNLAESNTAGTVGIANLLTNGTLTVSDVVASQGAASTSQLNFNGGTLKATATNLGATFLAGTTGANITSVNVFGNGGTIDNSGTAITIGHAMVAPAGQGVSGTTVAVAAGGTGYIGAPLVKLTGGTGTGATGYATVNGSGVVTAVTITSPGVGYTAGDTLTATFFGGVGNGGTAATAVTGIAVAANTSGGLTFTGGGTTTLTGANTYTGATAITTGTTLQIGDGTTDGSITATSNIVNLGTLNYNRSTGSTFTYGGVISGSGALIKSGAGTQALSVANTFTGGTTVTGGILTLAANGALGRGNATVATTATSLTIATGVTTPFNGAGSFTLTLAGGGTAAVADVGFLNLSSGANVSVAGLVLGTTTEPVGFVATAANSPDYILGPGTITVAAVPEPSTWVMMLGGLAGLVGWTVRRKRCA